MSTADPDLGDLLAHVLPTDLRLTIRHLSSTPVKCEPLFAAPPGEDPETTFCENHYLSVSINPCDENAREIIIFGMEVLVYTTAHLTTVFISKADSTGFLHLLKAPRKVSLLRLISTTFLSFLVRTRQREGVRLVLSLFARSQNQYLFPGSIKNAEKHVLDDRGLIKWWCRALDPILREYEPESTHGSEGPLDQTTESAKSSATAFLIIPGCDKFETRSFFPPSAKSDDKIHPRWVNSYPREQLCRKPDAPPRCLVPRFPDDPKTRFLIDLDDELPEPTETGGSGENSGQWLSVRSLDQFWELMSFRQECSAGRLVGFLWVVVNPPGLVNSIPMADTTAPASQDVSSSATAKSTITSEAKPEQLSNPFHWPDAGRGHVVLSETEYKSAIDFILEHEFYNEEVSIVSTKAWVDKVASLSDQLCWGKEIVGTNTIFETATDPQESNNLMDSSLIRKRKKADVEENKSTGVDSATPDAKPQPEPEQSSGVNVLNASLVRKKKKT
ncbi:DNA damage response protein [Aspergillus sclerotialis]|uniref:histone acetyltransferase n=1 Tax=Aspergillus sclerotialis TaxID=2070753 RepID=A0A3A2Z7L8_9EURO|nr:DNA damage response protein [Aspergillus sclerotialis]